MDLVLEPHQIKHDHFTRFRHNLGAMDPNFKIMFDELKAMRGSVDGLKGSLTERISGVEKSLGDRFADLESAAAAFEVWKPQMESSVEELR